MLDAYGHYVRRCDSDQEAGLDGYSYTSGLSYSRPDTHPELAAVAVGGMDFGSLQSILNGAAERLRSGEFDPEGPGYHGEIIGGFDVGVVPVRPLSSPSRIRVPGDPDVYLLVFPDSTGKFPWDEGCDPVMATQLDGFDCVALPASRISPVHGSRPH